MGQVNDSAEIVRFGLFEADLRTGELRKHGIKLKLPGQSFQVLAILLEHPGGLVTREEIRSRLWPADTFVDFDHSVNTAINKIREALADNAENPRFVETIPRRGYRFVAPVEQHRTPVAPAVPTQIVSSNLGLIERPRRIRRWFVVAAVLAGLTAAVGVFVSWLTPSSRPRVLNYTQITNDRADKMSVFSIGSIPPPMVTDGSRLYFNERREFENYAIGQVAVTGGETVLIPSSLPNIAVVGISPTGSDLLAYSFVSYESRVPLWVLPVLGGSPRRVGNFLAVDANWSADGQIVYTSDHDISITRIEGKDTHKLTSVQGLPAWPRWSPNGSVLRFTEYDPATDSSSLWEVSADGTHLHPLLPTWKHHAVECCGNWTPDGKYFVFQSTQNGRTDIWAIRERYSSLHTANPEPMQLTAGPMSLSVPVVSKDGKKLFALGARLRGELVRYDAKSQKFVTWLGGISATGLTFSPDGEWVAYVSFPGGVLWKSKSDGSQRLQLTFAPLEVSAPRWSPDGRRIAFMGRESGRAWRIYEVGSGGGANPEGLVAGGGIQAGPDWSPNGNSIVFAGLPEDISGDADASAVHIVDLGSQRTSTLPSSRGLYCPRWSPEGRYISATAADGHKLMLFDMMTEKWTELANLPMGCSTWSHDGKYLYFQTLNVKNPGVYRAAMQSRNVERLLSINFIRAEAHGWWSEVAPDGAPLLLRDESSEEIYALDWELP